MLSKKSSFIAALLTLAVAALVIGLIISGLRNKNIKGTDPKNVGGETENNSAEAAEESASFTAAIGKALYLDLGYINSAVTCGTADGKLFRSADNAFMLTDDETAARSGDGEEYMYQLTDKDCISVKFDDGWHIFYSVSSSSFDIPDCVANFDAVVEKASGGQLQISITDIPQAFRCIFQNEDVNSLKPLLLSADIPALNALADLSAGDLEGKMIRLWFDGQIGNIDPVLSAPIELGEIYMIRVIDAQ